MQEHERFLVKFTNLFKSIDNDQDGVISEIQFKDMLRMMHVLETEEEIERLLNKVDPFNNKKMTYSEVVQALSTEMVPREPDSINPSRKVALLEKFISEAADFADETNGYRESNQLEETNQGLHE